jgi:hypothetical protein
VSTCPKDFVEATDAQAELKRLAQGAGAPGVSGLPAIGTGAISFGQIEQIFVIPDIFISGRDQEPPTRPQPKIFYDFRVPIIYMGGAQRDEPFVIYRERFSGPNIPPCHVAFRRMAQAVYRELGRVESSADADPETIVGQETRSAELSAYLALLVRKCRHFANLRPNHRLAFS